MTSVHVVLTCLAFVVSFVDVVHGQLNWGKKVPCYEAYGTIICPGCNSRAGLTCPRRPKDWTQPEFQSCMEDIPTEFSPDHDVPTEFSTDYDVPTEFSTSNDITSYGTQESTLEGDRSSIPTTSVSLNSPVFRAVHPSLFLYNYFPLQKNRILRKVRESGSSDDGEICMSNADCPCPLICCKRGKGCPKRCVLGIRLPPPFGR